MALARWRLCEGMQNIAIKVVQVRHYRYAGYTCRSHSYFIQRTYTVKINSDFRLYTCENRYISRILHAAFFNRRLMYEYTRRIRSSAKTINQCANI